MLVSIGCCQLRLKASEKTQPGISHSGLNLPDRPNQDDVRSFGIENPESGIRNAGSIPSHALWADRPSQLQGRKRRRESERIADDR